jgi:hypothetical protein
MAEEKPSLHIDLDWKKQAQEEKRQLEEAEKKRAEERAAAATAAPTPAGVLPTTPAGVPAATPGAPAGGPTARGRGAREIPLASVQSLAQSLASQALFYLSDLAAQRGDEIANMDMAKHLIDTLGVLETKTANNLTPEEQQALDTALYESRMRFINTAGQIIAGA